MAVGSDLGSFALVPSRFERAILTMHQLFSLNRHKPYPLPLWQSLGNINFDIEWTFRL